MPKLFFTLAGQRCWTLQAIRTERLPLLCTVVAFIEFAIPSDNAADRVKFFAQENTTSVVSRRTGIEPATMKWQTNPLEAEPRSYHQDCSAAHLQRRVSTAVQAVDL